MLYTVSGCPRSGTSMMMNILLESLGADRLLGYDFPQMNPERSQNKMTGLQRFMLERSGQAEQLKQREDKARDMNPNGFFEMEFTVEGIKYNQKTAGILKSIREEKQHSFCKIVSQGLAHSDPQYIEKVIYMLRHPRAVAKSQEKLQSNQQRGAMLESLKNMSPDLYKQAIHTPEMFINVSGMASKWFIDNPEVTFIIVDYDELVEDPDSQIKRVLDFLGEGDLEKAKSVVDKKLKRSHPEEIPNPMWEDAEYIYEQIKKENFDMVLEHLMNPYTNTSQTLNKFQCMRHGNQTKLNLCRWCKQHKDIRTGHKQLAEKRKIDWKSQPCVYECQQSIDIENPITPEESIINNFWIEDE